MVHFQHDLRGKVRHASVTLFLALLAVVAQVVVAAAVALFVGRRLSPALDRVARSAADVVAPHALPIALAVAVISMAGSLYFSERAHFLPCTLCWYQRIAMYPLVPVLAVAAWRQAADVRWYALPLTVIGGSISTYHVLLERYPSLDTGACDPNNPCTLIWVERFGYLTIPAMALSAFALITVLLLTARSSTDHHLETS